MQFLEFSSSSKNTMGNSLFIIIFIKINTNNYKNLIIIINNIIINIIILCFQKKKIKNVKNLNQRIQEKTFFLNILIIL